MIMCTLDQLDNAHCEFVKNACAPLVSAQRYYNFFKVERDFSYASSTITSQGDFVDVLTPIFGRM